MQVTKIVKPPAKLNHWCPPLGQFIEVKETPWMHGGSLKRFHKPIHVFLFVKCVDYKKWSIAQHLADVMDHLYLRYFLSWYLLHSVLTLWFWRHSLNLILNCVKFVMCTSIRKLLVRSIVMQVKSEQSINLLFIHIKSQ